MSGCEKYFELKNVTKNFGGLRAVDALSFSVEKNKVTSLIGPNGAGKTTAFNLITGFLQPDAGEVYFRDKDITGLPPHEVIKLGLARTFQDLRLFNRLTALENVLLGMQGRRGEFMWEAVMRGRNVRESVKKDLQRALNLLDLVGLCDKADDLVENLSYGEQKLLAFARLLASDSDLLMLDEPASGLPLGTVDEILQLIKNVVGQGKTALVIEHNMEAVMGISDWIIVLNFGRLIASGTPEEIQKNEEVIKIYLGL